jgi:two-component system response regulator PilR (NtrC family)
LLNVFLDLVTLYLIIEESGGLKSPLLFISIPVAMAHTVIHGRNYALVISFLLVTIFGTTFTLSSSGDAILLLVGLLSTLILVVIGTGWLLTLLKDSKAEVERSKISLEDLSVRQKNLIDGITDGIITTLENLQIVSLNHAAEIFLNTAALDATGKRLATILSEAGATNFKNYTTTSLEFLTPQEITFQKSNNVTRVLSLSGRILKSGADTDERYLMFILQDVSTLKDIEGKLARQEEMARILSDDYISESPSSFENFIGISQVMRRVFGLIEKVAPSEATVLVTGESGTGKELVARAIHGRSSRASQNFIAVNCGAIPEGLIESELFGHKKGSFTGAISDALGLFRQADGGTIFLDEIGELPLPMQAKLLRTLQEKSVRAVGGDRDIPINIRIVAATNRDLRSEMQKGTFREDLFYRLNVIHLNLPPLRERREDIPFLVKGIISRLRKNTLPVVSAGAMELLLSYRYPGNVRELENIIERALVLGGDAILPEHLPELLKPIGKSSSSKDERVQQLETTVIDLNQSLTLPVNLDEILANIEREYLNLALKKARGVRKTAAKLLGINFRSLRYRLQKFDFESDLVEDDDRKNKENLGQFLP